MAEKRLRNRKRKASKGKAIRVSTLVYETLDGARRLKVNHHKVSSWDKYFRRTLGLPTRAGKAQPLIEGMLEVTSGMFILKLNETTWSELEETAYKLADSIARKKKISKAPQPLRMRELR